MPAQAAAADDAAATVAASAGTSWAETMRRKFDLETYTARLTTQLPALRTTAAARGADEAAALKAETDAQAVMDKAVATERTMYARHAGAKNAAKLAKKALVAAKKQKPASKTRVAKATAAVKKADDLVKSRAVIARTSTATLTLTRTRHAAAAKKLAAATTAHDTAVKTVAYAEKRIASWPKDRAALAAQATELSEAVVTQARVKYSTTQVYGVTVNRVVAFSFQRMIDDAAKAGVKLSGGGFRTREQQIALRKSNGCPDVWTAPSSSCRVPTAIPGRSLHEVGLAIDMTSGGSTINTRKSAAFKWMAANAGKYGFVNLPSEPWHWSITGS
ncbi:M15 family metallopeptidase [Actinoplanes sp. OR16]|uniref:M15 family metallopeptidase n=1 Tax=Actinoplanes sp. OR16 TaxID=946334 RepID=UPI001E2905D0|nr:M15 family metallopeptidase [Actinoplanes sp. OR16]